METLLRMWRIRLQWILRSNEHFLCPKFHFLFTLDVFSTDFGYSEHFPKFEHERYIRSLLKSIFKIRNLICVLLLGIEGSVLVLKNAFKIVLE